MATFAAMCLGASAGAAQASSIFATNVIEFFDSGVGPIAGPYGGGSGLGSEIPVTIADVIGDDGQYLSLPTGSFVTLGFVGSVVVDGPGDDLFVAEIGSAAETADVFVSGNGGLSFTFLAKASGDTVTGFDLADIGWMGSVNAVKVVGLDARGSSAGFDLDYVEGLEGSTAVVPLPAAAPLLVGAVAALGLFRRRA